MAAGKEFPLSLVIKAVDKATAPLRAINAKIQRITAPIAKLGNSFKAFGQEAGFGEVGSALGGVGSAAGNVGRQVGALAVKFAALAAGAGFALFRIIKSSSDTGDALAKTADRVGLSVDAFAQLQFVAGRAGISQDEFTTAMDQFNKQLGEAKAGTGALTSLLKAVSPALLQQVKGAKDSEAAFDLMMKALDRLKDPNKRAALAAAAFGRSGMKMGELVKNGTGEIAELRAEFARIAGSQEKFARGSEELNDAMGDVGTAFSGVSNAVMSELSPVLVDLAKQVKEFIVANRDGIAKWANETAASIKGWVDGGGLQRLIDGFKEIMSRAGGVVDSLGGFKSVIAVLAGLQLAPLISALGGLAQAFIVLGAAMLTTPIGLIITGIGLLGLAAYEIHKHWDGIAAFFSGVWEGVKNAFKTAWDFIAPIIEKLLNFVTLGGFGAIVNGAKALGGMLFGSSDARPTLGASAAAPPPATSAGGGATQVSVSFDNLPKGTRVTQKDDGPPVDLSLGYSMAGGG
jgi:phage-related minor tail protein